MDDKKNRTPSPDDPVTPEDYNPEHEREFPPDQSEVRGENEHQGAELNDYEHDVTDEKGRQPGMRRTGEFIIPDGENSAGEGWTVPTRPGGGWDHPVEPPLEEQIEEPENPGKQNKNKL